MEALPLYQQIYSDLLEKIRDGTYLENKSLPAERVLCQMYHVSRSTIRRTLDELQKEGYIVKAQGNGNFVKPKVFDQKLTKFHSFASSLAAHSSGVAVAQADQAAVGGGVPADD